MVAVTQNSAPRVDKVSFLRLCSVSKRKPARMAAIGKKKLTSSFTHVVPGMPRGRGAMGPSRVIVASLVLVFTCIGACLTVSASAEESAPRLDMLLKGGAVRPSEKKAVDSTGPSGQRSSAKGPQESVRRSGPRKVVPAQSLEVTSARTRAEGAMQLNSPMPPILSSEPRQSLLAPFDVNVERYSRLPYRSLSLKKIPPLYASPALPGEGEWRWQQMPTGPNGFPVMYVTTYRPSPKFPNAIVHMLLVDMKHVTMKLYLGSAEPIASQALSQIEPESKPHLLAVTNGLWKLSHSGGGGVVFRGTILRKLVRGMATLVAYKDGTVDVLEWDDAIPMSRVSDARQLKHLIVKDGQVVQTIVKGGVQTDAEIGMGSLLDEARPTLDFSWRMPGERVMNLTQGPNWFIATRSAFGIRPDGNLVFAVGHHISTKDLARALVLAGCVRAIHGDANPGNCVGNFYYPGDNGTITNTRTLSPKQDSSAPKRYLDKSYTSDFYAFFGQGARDDSGLARLAPGLR